MASMETPTKQQRLLDSEIVIPPSPFMKCLGFGTGISVYKLNRSPVCKQERSPWAIKKLMRLKSNETMKNRLKDEAIILKKLTHPNIIGFRALTRDTKGEICLAMEACTTSLGLLIEDRNEKELSSFPVVIIARVSYDISKALNYLHNVAHILHCDMKSYNILVQGDFEICKLCDFNISLPLEPDGTVSSEYLSEDPNLGTGPWMSPEAILHGTVTTKSDIYSNGLVIWEMIALTVPPTENIEDEEESICLNNSELNDSELSNISSLSNTTELKCINWRPELPAQEFSCDYDTILELFYCCTEKNPEFRPSADLFQRVCEENLNLLLTK